MKLLKVLVINAFFVATSAPMANVISPGFEMGAATSVLSFSPTDANNLGWFASNTDGERIQGTASKPAAEGNYYASLLQNAGAYNGSQLGIGNFGSTGFDRIYALFNVNANTVYDVSFKHAGDNRFNYLAGTSVVEIVDAIANSTITQQVFNTPSLFNWQTASFQFNSGSATQAAIAFTVMGSSNTSGVFDDIQISIANGGSVPVPGILTLFAAGFVGLGYQRRKQGKAA